MARVNWSAAAKRDLAAIGAYHEASSPAYAAQIVRRLYAAAEELAAFPHLGRAVPEIEHEAFRELVRHGHRIVYLVRAEEDAEEVDVLAVAHQRQDLLAKLRRP